MNNNYDITPGTDKFLRLHIDELSKPSRVELLTRKPMQIDPERLGAIVIGAISGGIAGVVIAFIIGLLP
jgi:hypothetical protein